MWKKASISAVAALGLYFLLKSKKPKIESLVNSLPHPIFEKRDLAQISYVVVHHTGTADSTTPQDIAQSKLPTGIGYHILIDKTGKIFLCNDFDSISPHTLGKNLSSIGVACIGNFDDNEIPEKQYKALLEVLLWLKREFKGIKIVPCQLFEQTSSPGRFLIQKLFPEGISDTSAIGAVVTKKELQNATRCSDGSYSTATGKPCKTRKGIHKTQKPILSEGSSPTGFEYFETYLVPINKIHTDEASFQNRRAKYSKESANKIIEAVEDGKFLWNVFDPIILWLNPKDKKLYVLSGHSRFNAFKELDKLGLSAQGRSFDKIPAKIIETDYKTAKIIALNSNSLATPETLLERTYYYRALLDSGVPPEEVKNTVKRMELGNWTLIWAWIHLNPDGKAMDSLRAFEGKDITSNENLKQVTYWLGATREKFPILSNFHENELFNFLIKGGYGKQFTRLPEFQEKIRTIIAQKNTAFSKLQPDEPLNLEATTTKSSYMLEYESEVNELKRKISELQKDRTKVLERLQKEKASRTEIDRILQPRDQAIRTQELKLVDLIKRKGNVLTAERNAPGLFGITEIPLNPRAGDLVFLDVETVARLSPSAEYISDSRNEQTIQANLLRLYYLGDYDKLNATSIANIAAVAVFSSSAELRTLHTQLLDRLKYYYSNISNLFSYE